jgi:hypothetical protein
MQGNVVRNAHRHDEFGVAVEAELRVPASKKRRERRTEADDNVNAGHRLYVTQDQYPEQAVSTATALAPSRAAPARVPASRETHFCHMVSAQKGQNGEFAST